MSVNYSLVKDCKYAVFFLHYQPERTTLPEAFGFVQQMRAILTLRAALPDGYVLLVKEHPSIFTNKCDPRFRSPHFYQAIHDLSGVEWVAIDADNFELIDSAALTASICGTVNTESLIRCVLTVYFGIQKFEELIGQHFYTELEPLEVFIEQAIGRTWSLSEISSAVETSIMNDCDWVVPKDSRNTREKRQEFFSRHRIEGSDASGLRLVQG